MSDTDFPMCATFDRHAKRKKRPALTVRSEPLLACPFCGTTATDCDPESGLHGVQMNAAKSKEDGTDVYFASCNVCGASGPLCDDDGMARNCFMVVRANAPREGSPLARTLDGLVGGKLDR